MMISTSPTRNSAVPMNLVTKLPPTADAANRGIRAYALVHARTDKVKYFSLHPIARDRARPCPHEEWRAVIAHREPRGDKELPRVRCQGAARFDTCPPTRAA